MTRNALKSSIAARFLLPLAAAAGLSACAKEDSGEDLALTSSEIAASAVSGSVTRGANVAARTSASALAPTSLAARDQAEGGACPKAATGQAGVDCFIDATGKVMTLTYNSCSIEGAWSRWQGSLILTSSAPVACGTVPSAAAGEALLLTYGEDTHRTVGNSIHVLRADTTNPSGYATPVSGGTFVEYLSDTSRRVSIRGLHLTERKEFRGKGNVGRVQASWDHSISTDAEAPLETAVNGNTKSVNGKVIVQHNLARFTGTSEFKDVVFDSTDGCCHPRSGSITTTLTGNVEGTETLTFTGEECGSADLNDSEGVKKRLLLRYCF